MPRPSKLTRSKAIQNACSITSIPVFEFLAPNIQQSRVRLTQRSRQSSSYSKRSHSRQGITLEHFFFSALSQAGSCKARHVHYEPTRATDDLPLHERKRRSGTSTTAPGSAWRSNNVQHDGHGPNKWQHDADIANELYTNGLKKEQQPKDSFDQKTNHEKSSPYYSEEASFHQPTSSRLPPNFFSEQFERYFTEQSHLPSGFYNDVKGLLNLIPTRAILSTSQTRQGPVMVADAAKLRAQDLTNEHGIRDSESGKVSPTVQGPDATLSDGNGHKPISSVEEQLRLLKSVRELEEKLAKAKQALQQKVVEQARITGPKSDNTTSHDPVFLLSKEDYINLVDLYYYSRNSPFSPESTDKSPTPSLLDDISFRMSEDFSIGTKNDDTLNEEDDYISPLKHVEEMLRQGKLREIAVMQVFIDLLLDDNSSNRALYEAYQNLPQPGVAHLPKGVIRLFLQRMSTPWTKSEKSMLRYLSLIDDMQQAKLPITTSEWSSAVYLAGRSFAKVTESDAAASFNVWQRMERDASVQSSHVTFNILFDIAVRAGKFALGQSVLKEMSKRNLRLNRLGRVSLIYYHGLRGDGDGIRKTYRDFVEAGEIVDTLVLNCVIAALLNAQEPTAADQVYERMKSLHNRLRKGQHKDGTESLFLRYPAPGDAHIDQEMAAAHLGRILLKAKHLRDVLPEHHQELQASMPLTPDIKTFSSMIAYHATKSGDLDRISVLLGEMTDIFNIPLEPLIFQLLFKGFALHGPVGGPDSPWSNKRLDLCWTAFRTAIKTGDAFFAQQDFGTPSSSQPADKSKSSDLVNPTLPSIKEINAIPPIAALPKFDPPLHNPPPRRLSTWNEFVLDLAAFPRQRLKRIERFHAQMFDDENAKKPHEGRLPHTFETPFFQSTVYTAPEPALDHEEGEYVLPNSAETTLLRPSTLSHGEEARNRTAKGKIVATRPLVCWLLRAYARNTKSRSKVEEIWGSIRKLWQPRDALERESVVRVLRRCLRDCDREGNG